MNSIVLGMESPPEMGGSPLTPVVVRRRRAGFFKDDEEAYTEEVKLIPRGTEAPGIVRAGELTDEDHRLRTGAIEEAHGLVAADPEHIPTGDPVQETSSTEEQSEDSPESESEEDRIQAAKKRKGGRKGGKGGGGGGGNNNNRNKNNQADEKLWGKPDQVKPALDRWSDEAIELDRQIGEEELNQEGEEPTPELKKLQDRRELLDKRIDKAKLRIRAEQRKQDQRKAEDELHKAMEEQERYTAEHGGRESKELSAKIRRLELDMNRAREEYTELMKEYFEEYGEVRFDDEPERPPASDPLRLNIPKSSEKDTLPQKALKGVKNTAVIGGAIVGNTALMGTGLGADLWKSLKSFWKNPSKMFGGWGWKDFFWRDEGKKK